MSKQQQAAQGSAAAADAKAAFSSMSPPQKIVHIGKACLFFLSMGFAYPNIFTD